MTSPKHQRSMSAYMAVRHLPTAEAARQLGKHHASVSEYRRIHPSVAYDPSAAPKTATVRPGIIQHIIPMVEPSRSSSIGSVPVMVISLPAPPWGGGFERHGVSA